MTPTAVRDALEAHDAVAAAEQAGVYALEVAVPDAVDAVQRRWLAAHDTPLPDGYATQLAGAAAVVYVGATGRTIRERLIEHARGEVRRALLLQAFDATDVAGVWPGAHSGVAERDRARAIADGETVAYCDGELF